MIGVFDSGLGGLTVLNSIRQKCSDQSLLYVADQAYSPYGDLPETAVLERSRVICRWLVDQGCQLIVVACNTATAIAIDQLRLDFPLPIVGVEPGVKPAALKSQTRKIGILATENTVASRRYQALIQQFIPNVEVISQGCSGLADAIESQPDQVSVLLHHYVVPLLKGGVDQIVLGCTHYPLVRSTIERMVGDQATVVDTSDAIAQEVIRRLPRSEVEDKPALRWYSTDLSGAQWDILRQYDVLSALQDVTPEALELPKTRVQG